MVHGIRFLFSKFRAIIFYFLFTALRNYLCTSMFGEQLKEFREYYAVESIGTMLNIVRRKKSNNNHFPTNHNE